jgi:hypothetical protein
MAAAVISAPAASEHAPNHLGVQVRSTNGQGLPGTNDAVERKN